MKFMEEISQGRVFNLITKTCQLCLTEKIPYYIFNRRGNQNKRNKLYNAFRQTLKELLENSKLKAIILLFWY
jgi:hypothetical protein